MRLKRRLKRYIPRAALACRRAWLDLKPLYPRKCPICGYEGWFDFFGRPPRLDAMCRRCGALERHRLFWTWFADDRSKMKEPILHFAPEEILAARFRALYRDYRTADLFDEDADLRLDIERIALESGSVNTVICNHVLEHVADRQALREIFRVLSDDGRLICSVPLIDGWANTYENDAITTPLQREVHFGQSDHVRYYGRDFTDRLREAGFSKVDEVVAEGPMVLDYGLLRGEKLFVCRKN